MHLLLESLKFFSTYFRLELSVFHNSWVFMAWKITSLWFRYMYCLVVQVCMFLCCCNIFSFNFITFSFFYSGSISPVFRKFLLIGLFCLCCFIFSFQIHHLNDGNWLFLEKFFWHYLGQARFDVGERTMPVLCLPIYHSQFWEREREEERLEKRGTPHLVYI